MKGWTKALLAAIFVTTAAHAGRQHFEPQWHTVTTDFVTPHTKWCKPLPGGKLNMLLIAPRPCQRDTVELAQRLDLDYDVLCAYTSGSLGWYENVGHTHILKFSPADRARDLREKLSRRPSVIAFGNFEWDLLPRESEYEILRQVRDGSGLLLSYHTWGQNDHLKRFLEVAKPVDDGGYITEGVPLRSLPAWRGLKTDKEAKAAALSARRFKRGRAVVLNYRGRPGNSFLIPTSSDAEVVHLDYYFSLVAKAALWAAGRESRVRLNWFCLREESGATVEEIGRADLPGARVAISLKGIGEADGKLWLRLRGLRGADLMTETVPLSQVSGPREHEVRLPALPTGGYYVDAIARGDEGVLNWWSCFFQVTSELGINSLTTDKATVRPNETLVASVELTQPALAGCEVRLTVTDSLDRVIERRIVPVREGAMKAQAELSFARALANLAYVDAELFHEGQCVCRFRVRQPVNAPLPRDDFGFLCWLGENGEYPWRSVRKILADHGVDCSNIGVGPVLAEANIRACPYSTRLCSTAHSPGPNIRAPCLTDAKYREPLRAKLARTAQVARLYGAAGYSLGDENYLSTGEEYCWSDTCKTYFRDYLKRTYAGLGALNSEWETKYADWGEIEPITLQQAREAGREGAFAEWTDHRMCMEELWEDIHRFCREAIHEVDPGARVGDEGSFAMTSFSGYDWWRQARVMDVWNIYPTRRHVLEMIRCFGKPQTYSGTWYGGYVQWSRWESRERWIPWFSVLHNLTAAWWFKAYSYAREQCQEDAIAADLTPFPCFLWSAEEIRDIKHGFGKLLLNCQRDNYGIAILYSQPSVHATTIDGHYGSVPDAEMGALHAIEDLGLQYDFVAYAQLAQGVLSKYRVLLAPCCLSMSAEEKEAIMAFVEAGGCFIADVRPGARDGHCKLVDDRDWQEFLGVRFGKSGAMTVRDTEIKGEIGDERVSVKLEGISLDPDIAMGGGRALGSAEGAPVAVLSRRGQGLAMLLNFRLGTYHRQPIEQTSGVRALLRAVTAASGIRPRVTVSAKPEPTFEGEVMTYTDGAARYVALLRDESEDRPTQKLVVTLPPGYQVYDSRAGRYLGHGTSVETAMAEGTTKVYALLPYMVADVKVSCPREVRAGGDVEVTVSVVCRDGDPKRHVVRLDVTGPDGKVQEHYGRNLEAKDGRGGCRVWLGLNDPAGRWRLVARDVASGREGTSTFEVKEVQ